MQVERQSKSSSFNCLGLKRENTPPFSEKDHVRELAVLSEGNPRKRGDIGEAGPIEKL